MGLIITRWRGKRISTFHAHTTNRRHCCPHWDQQHLLDGIEKSVVPKMISTRSGYCTLIGHKKCHHFNELSFDPCIIQAIEKSRPMLLGRNSVQTSSTMSGLSNMLQWVSDRSNKMSHRVRAIAVHSRYKSFLSIKILLNTRYIKRKRTEETIRVCSVKRFHRSKICMLWVPVSTQVI